MLLLCLPQTAGRADLEGLKGAMALLKKCSRTHTTISWKQLRISMEQQLDAALRAKAEELRREAAFFAHAAQQARRSPHTRAHTHTRTILSCPAMHTNTLLPCPALPCTQPLLSHPQWTVTSSRP